MFDDGRCARSYSMMPQNSFLKCTHTVRLRVSLIQILYLLCNSIMGKITILQSKLGIYVLSIFNNILTKITHPLTQKKKNRPAFTGFDKFEYLSIS